MPAPTACPAAVPVASSASLPRAPLPPTPSMRRRRLKPARAAGPPAIPAAALAAPRWSPSAPAAATSTTLNASDTPFAMAAIVPKPTAPAPVGAVTNAKAPNPRAATSPTVAPADATVRMAPVILPLLVPHGRRGGVGGVPPPWPTSSGPANVGRSINVQWSGLKLAQKVSETESHPPPRLPVTKIWVSPSGCAGAIRLAPHKPYGSLKLTGSLRG